MKMSDFQELPALFVAQWQCTSNIIQTSNSLFSESYIRSFSKYTEEQAGDPSSSQVTCQQKYAAHNIIIKAIPQN